MEADKLDRLSFYDYEKLSIEILEKIKSIDDEYESVSIIAKYENARKLIQELINFGCKIVSIDLHEEDYEGYCDEYIVSLGKDNEIWCEQFKRNNEYFNNISIITYIFDNCSSKVLPHCKSKYLYEISIDDDMNEEDDDIDEYNGIDETKNNCDSKVRDDNMHGFSITKTGDHGHSLHYSFYTSEELNNEDIKDILEFLEFYF